MSTITIEDLSIYPLKSAKAINLEKVNVLNTGFENDRLFGIINMDNTVLTAREKPRLLHLRISFSDSVSEITDTDNNKCSVDLKKVASKAIQVNLFNESFKARVIARVANEYLSNFLKEKVRLISIEPNELRKVNEKHNGQPDDVISLNDVAPLLLVNKASINDLNSKLEQPISNPQFRANIVVSTPVAYDEETWKYVKIGNCEFEVITRSERCILFTIDPVRAHRHPKQEPLRTLAKDKRGNDTVSFGVYLVPRKLGEISATDTLEVIS